MYWSEKRILVTGGASFIGSHLVDKLVSLGASVTVIDNLSSGTSANLANSSGITFLNLDLEYSSLNELVRVFKGNEIVFHLAATHGGRGYIDSHPADVCSNFSIDHHVLEASCLAGVEKVVLASSACVYPPQLSDLDSEYLLREHVSDIVDGTILAAEKVSDGTPINLGTGKRFKLVDVASMIFNIMDFHPDVVFDLNKPTGVVNRALDISRAKEMLGWEPRVSLKEGLERTIAWYKQTHIPIGIVNDLLLMERQSSTSAVSGIGLTIEGIPNIQISRKVSG